jgi:hypothetical protein
MAIVRCIGVGYILVFFEVTELPKVVGFKTLNCFAQSISLHTCLATLHKDSYRRNYVDQHITYELSFDSLFSVCMDYACFIFVRRVVHPLSPESTSHQLALVYIPIFKNHPAVVLQSPLKEIATVHLFFRIGTTQSTRTPLFVGKANIPSTETNIKLFDEFGL